MIQFQAFFVIFVAVVAQPSSLVLASDSDEVASSPVAVITMHDIWAVAQIVPCIHKGNCPSPWATAQEHFEARAKVIAGNGTVVFGQLPSTFAGRS